MPLTPHDLYNNELDLLNMKYSDVIDPHQAIRPGKVIFQPEPPKPDFFTTGGGKKFDGGKLRMDLLPPKAIKELAKVLTYGANKYEDNNWQKVETKRYVAALFRHMMDWMDGEDCDVESGIHHLSHVLCNAAFLVHKEVNADVKNL